MTSADLFAQLPKYMTVEVQDGSIWGVPIEMIAKDRAGFYSEEFEGDLERSLVMDTLPLFIDSEYEIHDWAVNNMNWDDFAGHQVKLKAAPAPDFQDAWLSGTKGVSN